MKRSDMLKIIEKCWTESTSFPTDQLVAKYILDSIEKAGMKPPFSNKMFQIDARISMCPTGCKWEPEVEELKNEKAKS